LGNDAAYGGAGIDTATYVHANQGVTVSLTTTGPQDIGDGEGTEILAGIENLTGSNYNDVLTAKAGTNILIGGLGNDTLNGGAGFDTLQFTHAFSGVKVDLMLGEATGEGNDRLSLIENVDGTSQNDVLLGNGTANVLVGGAGKDTLAGLRGNDTLDGGLGFDVVSYAAAAFGVTVSLTVTGGQAIGGDEGMDTLIAIEAVEGSRFGDTLAGSNLANTLRGAEGDDSLSGADGNDTIAGGKGSDHLSGGTGRDVFVYTAAKESWVNAFDTVDGFDAADDKFDVVPNVTGIDAAIATGALSAATFKDDIAAAANKHVFGAGHAILFTADSGDMTGTTLLIIDGNGRAGFGASQDVVIRLDGAVNLAALDVGDFI
jgi:Ca2+-binding RTX toxin-like protein